MNIGLCILAVSMENLKKLKESRDRIHMSNIQNMLELAKIADTAIEQLDKQYSTSENSFKARALLTRLKDLVEEREKIYLKIRDNQMLLERKYENSTQQSNNSEYQEILNQRNQAFELSKRMLATLKCANMRMEENSKKVKRSADLMFHVMYKVEDKYLDQ